MQKETKLKFGKHLFVVLLNQEGLRDLCFYHVVEIIEMMMVDDG